MASPSIPGDDDAVERLFAVKGRDAATAIPLIAASIEQAQAAADLRRRELRAGAQRSGRGR